MKQSNPTRFLKGEVTKSGRPSANTNGADNRLQLGQHRQHFSALDITTLWAGINICLPSFMLGGILVPDLSLIDALVVTIAGNLILTLLIFFMGLPGVERGYSSVFLSRSTFGHPLGSFIPSLVVLISMIGWAAILLNLSGQAAAGIIDQAAGLPAEKFFMIIIGLLVILSTLGGPEKMNYLNRFNVPALLILTGWIAYMLLKTAIAGELLSFKPTGGLALPAALDLVVGGTIAGVYVSSDLSRYAGKKSALGIGVLAGTVPPTVILALLGMFSRITTGSWNPVSVIGSLGMGIPALLLIILSAWTTIQVSLYSGGLVIANLIPGQKRRPGVVILGLLMIVLALNEVINYFENWLILLNNLFTPMIAITLIHYFLLPLLPATLSGLDNPGDPELQKINWSAFLSLIISLPLNQLFVGLLPLPAFLISLISTSLIFLLISCFARSFLKADG